MELFETLKQFMMFQSLTKEEFEALDMAHKLKIALYEKEEMIVQEDAPAQKVGLLLFGSCKVFKSFESGKELTLTTLKPGDIFGEIIVFSGHQNYPASICAAEKSTVCLMNPSDMLNWCMHSKHFLSDFLKILSLKILLLNKKTKALSFTTIRGKIANLLLDYRQKYQKDLFEVPLNRKNMADYLGIPRPSLSRELIKMKQDGLIDYYQNSFKILSLEGLKGALTEEKE